MSLKVLSASIPIGTKTLLLKEDSRAGWYLLVFDDGRCVADYLQDTLEQAFEQAEEDFGVARADWSEVSDA